MTGVASISQHMYITAAIAYLAVTRPAIPRGFGKNAEASWRSFSLMGHRGMFACTYLVNKICTNKSKHFAHDYPTSRLFPQSCSSNNRFCFFLAKVGLRITNQTAKQQCDVSVSLRTMRPTAQQLPQQQG
eukprot:GHVQ01012655.1.p2 GENE.GHVQ01012655.1~~GHVQ01012655.1.p2  ORF type:complete len:130 (+),score=8.78 GHVQ01012655.1:221-610(+)